ncbi:hypothetical protein FQA39_LY13750 [Lamprigera yunnana]|nr:hypothetical protein FQA39_LY13750 [Lamprigera yunnana]
MKVIILSALCALAVAQSPSPLPVQVSPIPFHPRFGPPQPYPGGFPFGPGPQPKPLPRIPAPAPAPVPAPKPVPVPAARVPVGILSQNYHPYHPQEYVAILKQNQNSEPSGNYQWDFAAANGITAYENAEIVPLGPEQASKTVTGGYQYTSLEGIPVEVTYTADENGFHPHVVVHTHHYGREGKQHVAA